LKKKLKNCIGVTPAVQFSFDLQDADQRAVTGSENSTSSGGHFELPPLVANANGNRAMNDKYLQYHPRRDCSDICQVQSGAFSR
jgi:hypothetical protein